jgi:holo-[acyl-carrier protein] synthase
MIGIGIDIQAIGRMEELLARYDDQLTMVFTTGELDRAKRVDAPARILALCFSAKEAMGKALGTGLSEIDWGDIEAEVREGTGQLGQLAITLSGKALLRAQRQGVSGWIAGWTTWDDQVLVTVVVQ